MLRPTAHGCATPRALGHGRHDFEGWCGVRVVFVFVTSLARTSADDRYSLVVSNHEVMPTRRLRMTSIACHGARCRDGRVGSGEIVTKSAVCVMASVFPHLVVGHFPQASNRDLRMLPRPLIWERYANFRIDPKTPE